jgi:hypothetical protein
VNSRFTVLISFVCQGLAGDAKCLQSSAKGCSSKKHGRANGFSGATPAPWDWNWQPPLSGDPRKIADDFHAAACGAVFRVPLFDFVKCALGYIKALFIESLLNTARDIRTSLQSAFRNRPETKDTYIKVEKFN